MVVVALQYRLMEKNNLILTFLVNFAPNDMYILKKL